MRFLICNLSLLIFFQWNLSAQESNPDIVIGKKHSVHSEILNQDRPFMVYLPQGYEEATIKYPVMYLLDGGGNFNHTTACVQLLARNGRIPEMIVIGIPNTDDRTRDLTPKWESNTGFPSAGGADNMLSFIKQELMPYVNEKFRTNDYKLLVGHSFGGLFAIHTLVNHPGSFNSYLAISPSLWWNNQILATEEAQTYLSSSPDVIGHLFITLGDEKGDMLQGVQKLTAFLAQNAPKDLKWKFDHMPEESHGTVPYRSTYNGLQFIFSEWNLTAQHQAFLEMSGNPVEVYEKNIQKYYGLTKNWDKRQLMNTGNFLFAQNAPEKALPFF